ncbi:MAG: hypothetical protein M1838_000546 [Thelocarpon superellum]|nr:MAG: hypothetical protein M1838_000546 [Thelocarpon superellum]
MSFGRPHPAVQAPSTQPKYFSHFSPASPQKRQKMSVTQTYYLAHQARAKLSSEAAQPDHNLRLLVGHANLLDSLMVELADAEQDQERWFNQTVKGAAKTSSEAPKHIQWADTIVEADEDSQMEEAESDSSDSESESDEEESFMAAAIPLQRMSKAAVPKVSVEAVEVVDEDISDYEDDEDYSELALVRTSSRQPPELSHDSDEDSEDDSMPPSPPQPTFLLPEKQRNGIATTSFYDHDRASQPKEIPVDDRPSCFDDNYYLPDGGAPALITAC